MWGLIIKKLIEFVIFVVIPFVVVIAIAPRGEFLPGMDSNQWFTNTLGCIPGSTDCDITSTSVCWLCDIFEKFFNVAANAVDIGFNVLVEDSLMILALGFAVWLLWKSIETLLDFENAKSANEFFKMVIDKIAKVLFVALLLGVFTTGQNNILRSAARGFIEPIMTINSVISMKILNIDSEKLCPLQKAEEEEENPNSIFTNKTKKSMTCMLGGVSTLGMAGIQGGGNLIYLGTSLGSILNVFAGYMIITLFFGLMMLFPFWMLSILLTLMIAVFTLPVFIVGYAFEATEKLMKTIMQSVVSAGMKMIGLTMAFLMLYLIFTTVGDRYYPAPQDGFSYIFPDHFRHGASQKQTELKQQFEACYQKIANTGKSPTRAERRVVKECLKKVPLMDSMNGFYLLLLIYGLTKIGYKLFFFIQKKTTISGSTLVDTGEKLQRVIMKGATSIKSILKMFTGKIKIGK